ncbi:MAG: hypothetical protein GX649_13920, partial [Chloroflexi bacterium]|nr:hypothetical protein [Chloroflexota bacterium]
MSHYPAARRRPITALFLALALLVALPLAPASAQTPVAPTPLAPEGETIYPTEATPLAIPEFRWTAVEGATSYRLQVSRDNFATLALNVTTANTAYTPLQSSSLPDGTWTWRVRVEKPTPASDYSGPVSFTKRWAVEENKPLLKEPAEGDRLAFFDSTTFSWEPVLGAASYRFQIAASVEGFSSPLVNIATLATAVQPTAKRANGTYYWRIVPLDPNDREGVPSDVRSFEVDYDLMPILIEPIHNDRPTFTPTFRWEAVRGAEYYTLQYATDPTFNSGVTSLTTRNTAYTPTSDLPNDVNYFWRVRAHSGASVGPWSAERSFLKEWYLQPTLLTPTNYYQYVHNPMFSWTPVPGAVRYRFEINSVNSFPPP